MLMILQLKPLLSVPSFFCFLFSRSLSTEFFTFGAHQIFVRFFPSLILCLHESHFFFGPHSVAPLLVEQRRKMWHTRTVFPKARKIMLMIWSAIAIYLFFWCFPPPKHVMLLSLFSFFVFCWHAMFRCTLTHRM